MKNITILCSPFSLRTAAKILFISGCLCATSLSFAATQPVPYTYTADEHTISIGERFHTLIEDASDLSASVFSGDTRSPNENSFWFADPQVDINQLGGSGNVG